MGGQACGVEKTNYKLDLQSGKLDVASCSDADGGATRSEESAILSADDLAVVRQTLEQMTVSSEFTKEFDGPMTVLALTTSTGPKLYADAQRCNNDPSALRVSSEDLRSLQAKFLAALEK